LARPLERARIDRLKKRIVALAFLAVVVALVAATFVVLRTRWAGERICALVAARAQAAAGLPLAFRSCRVVPLTLEVEAEAVRLGPPGAPVFAADRVAVRLAAVQALGGRVRIARAQLERPRVAATIPASRDRRTRGCPTDLLSRLEVRDLEISDGSLDLSFPGGIRVTAARIDVRTRSPIARTLRALAARPRSRVEATAEDVRLTGVDDRPFTSPRAALAADVALDLSSAQVAGLDAVVDGVRFAANGRVRDLCAPSLDLDVRATGPLRDVLALARVRKDAPASGTVSAELHVGGPAARPEIGGSLRFADARVGWFRPGAGRATVKLAPGLDALVVERVEWPLPGGTVVARGRVGFQRTVPMEWEAETSGADLADVLESVGIEGSWVSVRLDAKGHVAGNVLPSVRLAGGIAGDFRDLRTHARSWKTVKPGTVPVLQAKRGQIETPILVTEEALSYEGARVTAGRGTSVVDAVARFSAQGGYDVRWRGQVDLDVLGAVAEVPVGGLAEVDATIGAARYGNPRATGRARVEGFRFNDVALGNATGEFDYGPDFVVRVREAEGVFRQSRWRGEGAVDLAPSPPQVRSSRFEARGRVGDLLDAVQDWVPRTRQFRDAFEGEIAVSGTAAGPTGLLGGTFEARMATGTLYGRPFDSARASGTFERGEEARFERAEIRRGAGTIQMTGRYGFSPPFPWDLDVAFAGVPLADAGLPGGAWGGSASGTVTLRGSFVHPDVRFAANGDGVAVRGVALGTVQAAGTAKEERLVVTGGAEGLRFEAEATLAGRLPFRARADLAVDDVARIAPGTVLASLKPRIRGEASADGELRAFDAATARVRLDELQIGQAEFKVRAAGPVVLSVSGGRVEMQEVKLVGANTELTVGGTGAASGQLDLAAAGTLDLRLLAGVVPDLRRPHGQLAVEAHVTGTLEDPVLVGAGRLNDAGFQLKTTSILFAGVRGALAFSQNRVLFDDLSAAVNGGRAKLRGELELASFVPVRLRVEALLDEVPVAVPATLPVTLSGRVEAAGTPDAATVTGRLHVVRARYTADVNLERSLLELRRRVPPPPRAYDKGGEWLRLDLQVVVDGDARIENDLVSGAVSGEITVTGTLASPGAVGTLSMAEGSRARFRGNEFALSHAVLDLTDRNKVEIALDVHGQSQVREYQIFMHAFGPIADPQLTLTSAPPLSQPDIITLLSLGFTRRDATAGGGVQGVATAAAAQALFSASGLDEQVKRFVPRGQMVRDLSVRITTDMSAEGQVEPRAEFESFLLRERLRLRYQAPLSGSRGQRAQAELKLGRHTAVQYQWDNDNPDVVTGDHGVDLKLRWEWTDE
jgi:translocation and assembly module TamB